MITWMKKHWTAFLAGLAITFWMLRRAFDRPTPLSIDPLQIHRGEFRQIQIHSDRAHVQNDQLHAERMSNPAPSTVDVQKLESDVQKLELDLAARRHP